MCMHSMRETISKQFPNSIIFYHYRGIFVKSKAIDKSSKKEAAKKSKIKKGNSTQKTTVLNRRNAIDTKTPSESELNRPTIVLRDVLGMLIFRNAKKIFAKIVNIY